MHMYLKFCWNPEDMDELNDLKNDPKEMNNIIDIPEYKSIRQELKKRLSLHLKSADDPLYNKISLL